MEQARDLLEESLMVDGGSKWGMGRWQDADLHKYT